MTRYPRPDFWKGKRVLVTGHTGFKGSWLSLWLDAFGARLAGYALPPSTRPSLFAAAGIGKRVHSVFGDIRDLSPLKKMVRSFRPEIVFHLAAQPLVLEGYRDPVGTYSVNVMGTANLLEAARRVRGLKAIINVTTDKVYQNKEYGRPFHEDSRLGGADPYGSSKACAELVTAAYAKSFFSEHDYGVHGVALATARSGNVIGGGDWAADRLVPDVMRALCSNKRVMIRSPQAVRPWQHVLDPLRGYLMLAERLVAEGPKFGGAWNFGPSPRLSKPVGWVVDQLSALWSDESSGWVRDGKKYPYESASLKLDSSRAARRLGWRCLLPVGDALRLVVDWCRDFSSGADIATTSVNQISRIMRSGREAS